MGIGTLGERSLHAALKRYCEPDESRHEIKVGRYVADVLRDSEILEIQTRNFHSMKAKLKCFLADRQVTVIHPISHVKHLIWVDPQTGESTKPRRSPKVGVIQELFYELIGLRDYLTHPNLRFRVILVDVEEYRTLDGWSRDGKKGSHRAERIPLGIVGDFLLETKADWERMLPADLPQPFTCKDFAKACGISQTCANRGIFCLKALGVIRRCGKQGRAFLYESVPD